MSATVGLSAIQGTVQSGGAAAAAESAPIADDDPVIAEFQQLSAGSVPSLSHFNPVLRSVGLLPGDLAYYQAGHDKRVKIKNFPLFLIVYEAAKAVPVGADSKGITARHLCALARNSCILEPKSGLNIDFLSTMFNELQIPVGKKGELLAAAESWLALRQGDLVPSEPVEGTLFSSIVGRRDQERSNWKHVSTVSATMHSWYSVHVETARELMVKAASEKIRTKNVGDRFESEKAEILQALEALGKVNWDGDAPLEQFDTAFLLVKSELSNILSVDSGITEIEGELNRLDALRQQHFMHFWESLATQLDFLSKSLGWVACRQSIVESGYSSVDLASIFRLVLLDSIENKIRPDNRPAIVNIAVPSPLRPIVSAIESALDQAYSGMISRVMREGIARKDGQFPQPLSRIEALAIVAHRMQEILQELRNACTEKPMQDGLTLVARSCLDVAERYRKAGPASQSVARLRYYAERAACLSEEARANQMEVASMLTVASSLISSLNDLSGLLDHFPRPTNV